MKLSRNSLFSHSSAVFLVTQLFWRTLCLSSSFLTLPIIQCLWNHELLGEIPFLPFHFFFRRIDFYEQRGLSLVPEYLPFPWTSEINIAIEKFIEAIQKVPLGELVTTLHDFLINSEEKEGLISHKTPCVKLRRGREEKPSYLPDMIHTSAT